MKRFIYKTKIGLLLISADEIGITNIDFVNESDFNEYSNKYNMQETAVLKEAKKQLDEYLKGSRQVFNLPLNLKGSEFQMKVWDVLRQIPYGETWTYKKVAEKIGNPKASRAVGMANNKNPLMIVVPCHRVIGTNGKLIGYAGGLDLKKRLLELENINPLV
ncbi:MAG TPA: methylated-DNA--[protein]-cysteine S-methyltransferase [Clostridiales bacterium]|nr:methylated-DNA--[protein]-cysteine S-methyltransferase [Clostridiales bacterium]